MSKSPHYNYVKAIRRVVLSLLVLGVLEFGVFEYWWLRSSKHVEYFHGSKLTIVDFQMTPFIWNTSWVWYPPFRIIPALSGYAFVKVTLAGPEAVYTFAKEEPETTR